MECNVRPLGKVEQLILEGENKLNHFNTHIENDELDKALIFSLLCAIECRCWLDKARDIAALHSKEMLVAIPTTLDRSTKLYDIETAILALINYNKNNGL